MPTTVISRRCFTAAVLPAVITAAEAARAADADTTAAVAGQLAGAFYGVGGIPDRWLRILAMRAEIEAVADRLLELAGRRA